MWLNRSVHRYTAAVSCCKALELECTRLRDLRQMASDLEVNLEMDGLQQQVIQLLGDIAAASVVTSLSIAASAGDTVLQVESTQGFKKGTVAIIGTPGAVNCERVVVDKLGSLHLATPLEHRHAAGEPVTASNERDSYSEQTAAAAEGGATSDWFRGQQAGSANDAENGDWFRGQPAGSAKDAEIGNWFRGQPASSAKDAEIGDWFRGQPASSAKNANASELNTVVDPLLEAARLQMLQAGSETARQEHTFDTATQEHTSRPAAVDLLKRQLASTQKELASTQRLLEVAQMASRAATSALSLRTDQAMVSNPHIATHVLTLHPAAMLPLGVFVMQSSLNPCLQLAVCIVVELAVAAGDGCCQFNNSTQSLSCTAASSRCELLLNSLQEMAAALDSQLEDTVVDTAQEVPAEIVKMAQQMCSRPLSPIATGCTPTTNWCRIVFRALTALPRVRPGALNSALYLTKHTIVSTRCSDCLPLPTL